MDMDYEDEDAVEAEMMALAGVKPRAVPAHWRPINRGMDFDEQQKETRRALAARMSADDYDADADDEDDMSLSSGNMAHANAFFTPADPNQSLSVSTNVTPMQSVMNAYQQAMHAQLMSPSSLMARLFNPEPQTDEEKAAAVAQQERHQRIYTARTSLQKSGFIVVDPDGEYFAGHDDEGDSVYERVTKDLGLDVVSNRTYTQHEKYTSAIISYGMYVRPSPSRHIVGKLTNVGNA